MNKTESEAGLNPKTIWPHIWFSGQEITLPELLDCREKRFLRQQRLLADWTCTLICLTLNIPGPQKIFPLAEKTFQTACREIRGCLAASSADLLQEETHCPPSGYEGYFLVSQDAVFIKMRMTEIEETHPLGRIFDIDVIDSTGRKISRSEIAVPGRTCLLCSNPVFLCSRNRTHSARELFHREAELMTNYFHEELSRKIAGLFTKAMTYEVTTTPKPGLVDRWHTGAHRDMDISLFMDSIDALFPYFQECSFLGSVHSPDNLPLLFQKLRKLGRKAEQTMYQATGNVNTHKGLIFSGGILCAAAAFTYTRTMTFDFDMIADTCRKMLLHLSEDFDNLPSTGSATAGLLFYHNYGLKGIRGEAMHGYPTLFHIGWRIFSSCQELGFPLYQCGRIALLYFIAYSEDTNIITRSSYETWLTITKSLQEYLEATPLPELPERAVIQNLDTYFLKNNISPGGSADLLALVYFLHFLSLPIL